MDDGQKSNLNVNIVRLLELVDSDLTFLNRLGAVECIVWRQRDYLITIPQPCERNDKLIEILIRRSVADFNKFVSVLAEQQPHLVPLLCTGGGELLLYNCSEFCQRTGTFDGDG